MALSAQRRCIVFAALAWILVQGCFHCRACWKCGSKAVLIVDCVLLCVRFASQAAAAQCPAGQPLTAAVWHFWAYIQLPATGSGGKTYVLDMIGALAVTHTHYFIYLLHTVQPRVKKINMLKQPLRTFCRACWKWGSKGVLIVTCVLLGFRGLHDRQLQRSALQDSPCC